MNASCLILCVFVCVFLARATVTGPTAEAVNKAVALLDFVREKVPLPNPPLRKAELQALCSYVLSKSLKFVSTHSCVKCRQYS